MRNNNYVGNFNFIKKLRDCYSWYSISSVKSNITTYVDESGKELLPKKEGIHEKEKINGYEYVKTITKDNGNVEHVYKKVTEKKLPNTSVGIFGGIAGVLGLTGVGAYFNTRKRKKIIT